MSTYLVLIRLPVLLNVAKYSLYNPNAAPRLNSYLSEVFFNSTPKQIPLILLSISYTLEGEKSDKCPNYAISFKNT